MFLPCNLLCSSTLLLNVYGCPTGSVIKSQSQSQLKFLKQFFLCNNFPINFIDKCFKKTINFIYNGKTSYATVPKKPINIKLPFLGPQTYIAKRKLSALITKFYPHVSIRFIITPSLIVQNLFSFKDKLLISLVSSVIYKYSCG